MKTFKVMKQDVVETFFLFFSVRCIFQVVFTLITASYMLFMLKLNLYDQFGLFEVG